MADRGLGPLEARIMAIFWETSERQSVRDVMNQLDNRLAYTTVMTVMSRLADKGLLTRRKLAKSYAYEASGTKVQFLARRSSLLTQKLIDDFGDLALANFVEQIERSDPQRLERLRVFLERGTGEP